MVPQKKRAITVTMKRTHVHLLARYITQKYVKTKIILIYTLNMVYTRHVISPSTKLKSLINDLRCVYILQRDRLKDLLSLTLQ